MNSGHASVVAARQSGAVSSFRRALGSRYTKRATLGVLWLFGLFSVFLSPAPVTITPEMQQRYDIKDKQAAKIDKQLAVVSSDYFKAVQHTNEAKVWFWRFKAEAREEVYRRQIGEREEKKRMQALQQSHRSAVADANAELGVWTDAGVDRSRRLFWDSYNHGKLFAQRQSFVDCLFNLIAHRDSDALGHFLSFLVIVCFNFMTGMLSALLIYIAQLPYLIASFRPSFLSGLLFFITSAIGGISVVVTFLVLLFGSSAVIAFAVTTPRLQAIAAEEQRRRGAIPYRPHSE